MVWRAARFFVATLELPVGCLGAALFLFLARFRGVVGDALLREAMCFGAHSEFLSGHLRRLLLRHHRPP